MESRFLTNYTETTFLSTIQMNCAAASHLLFQSALSRKPAWYSWLKTLVLL